MMMVLHQPWEEEFYLYLTIRENSLPEFGKQMAACTSLNWVFLNSAKSHKKRKKKRCGSGIIGFAIKTFVRLMT